MLAHILPPVRYAIEKESVSTVMISLAELVVVSEDLAIC
jgi:hypothetical protein